MSSDSISHSLAFRGVGMPAQEYPRFFTQPWLDEQPTAVCFYIKTTMEKKITKIEAQKNPQRVSVHLDDEFAFGLSRIVAAWLKVGQELTEEEIAELQLKETLENAYQRALHFINYRPRSEAEVRKNLEKHDLPEMHIEQTLQRLKQIGLVDDEAFARVWVENRSEFRPRSHMLLRVELRRKGIAEETIQHVLEQSPREETLALKAARKHVHRLKDLAWPNFYQKMSGFLARRGFSFSIISPMVSQVWEETLTEKKREISHHTEDDR